MSDQRISDRCSEALLFESAFRHAPIGKALFSADGRLLKVNPAFCALVGYDETFLLSTTFQAITHPDDIDQSFDHMARLQAGQIANYRVDKRYRRGDGAMVWAQVAVSMVREHAGAEPFFIAQCEDLTASRAAQQALRESEARYRLIAENTSDMIVCSNLAGRITFVASSCEPQTGYTQEELLGQRPLDFAVAEDIPGVWRVFTELLQGGVGRRVLWRTHHKTTGQLLWLESYPALLRDPQTQAPIGFLDVIRDVTEPVIQRQALASAQAEAIAAAAVKSEFLANMSHEIRTPVTAILGFADLLARQALAPESRRHVDQIVGAGRGLLAVVNDVLDFSRLEAGQIEIAPTPVRPADLAREVLDMFSLQAADKGLNLQARLAPDLPDHVSIDADRLRQILVNLVGNAVKFTAQGQVVLDLSHAAQTLTVRVVDTGQGIAPDQQSRLFQRFSQVDGSTTRRHGGTGLGLAICKGLAEAMGGDIALQSQAGSGSCFTVRLPAPAIDAVAEPDDGQDEISLDGTRVLVVDDNPANRDLARALLEHFGACVVDAAGGGQGVAAARASAFDVILMDLRMPEVSGRDAAMAIRGVAGPNRHTPILAFTAEAETVGRQLQPDFDGVVRKPLVAIDLLLTVANARSRRAQDLAATA